MADTMNCSIYKWPLHMGQAFQIIVKKKYTKKIYSKKQEVEDGLDL